MKQISLFVFFLFLGLTSIKAQNTKTEVDAQKFQQEMQGKMEKFQQEVETSMKLMQEQMENIEFKNLGDKNQVIINGDTIIIAGDEIFPGMDFNELFQKMPENMPQLDFFFGGEQNGLGDIFKIMEDFTKGETPSITEPSTPQKGKTPITPKKKRLHKGKDENNRQIYSL